MKYYGVVPHVRKPSCCTQGNKPLLFTLAKTHFSVCWKLHGHLKMNSYCRRKTCVSFNVWIILELIALKQHLLSVVFRFISSLFQIWRRKRTCLSSKLQYWYHCVLQLYLMQLSVALRYSGAVAVEKGVLNVPIWVSWVFPHPDNLL